MGEESHTIKEFPEGGGVPSSGGMIIMGRLQPSRTDFRDLVDPAEDDVLDGTSDRASADRVVRNDMRESSPFAAPDGAACFVGGALSARRRAFVPGAKSDGSPLALLSWSASWSEYHLTASIKSPKRGAVSVMIEPSAAPGGSTRRSAGRAARGGAPPSRSSAARAPPSRGA